MKPKVNVTIEKDSDGWWAYTPPGWKNGNDGGHTFRENTKKELMNEIRYWLEHCDCYGCHRDMMKER